MTLPENKSKESDDHLIKPWEEFWVTHQPFLLERGYRLRDRYDPNWVPSWRKPRRGAAKNFKPLDFPDGMVMGRPIVDAIRLSDGIKVVMKRVRIDRDIRVLEYLNSPALLDDTRNCTVPLLDKILVPDDPESAWVVMPLLLAFDHYRFPFRFISEVIECVAQFLEGLELMHEHGIAHRDACKFNLMVDSTKLIPDGDFCIHRTNMKADWKSRVEPVVRRTVAPLKYYFIDFETALWFPPEEKNPLCVGRCGQDRSVPELSDTVPYNPFKLDIYQLGMVFTLLSEQYEDLEFLKPLLEAMTCSDPEQRPTAKEAKQLFRSIISSFAETDMTRRVWRRDLPLYLGQKIEFRKRPLSTRILQLFCFKR